MFRNRTYLKPAAAGAVLLAAAGIGIAVNRTPASAEAAAAPRPVPPGYFRPTPDQWSGLEFTPVASVSFAPAVASDGAIQSDETRTTPIFSPLTGRVTRVFVQSGQRVAQGAPLFEVQASELVQASADLRTATAARNAAAEALAVADNAYKRQQRLLEGGAAAAKDAQAAAVDRANAQSQLAAAEASLSAARGRLALLGQSAPSPSAVGIVRAPVAGTVVARSIGPGQFVQSAAIGANAPLLTLSDVGHVWLVANLREADAAAVHPGDPIEARVAAFPGRSFSGRVTSVAATVDPVTRRVPARASVDNPGGMLRPGMFAEMRLIEGAAADHLGVPEKAVIYEGDEARVWVAGPDHTLGLRLIEAGRTENGIVEVLAGLRPGDRVVSAGALFIDRAAKAE